MMTTTRYQIAFAAGLLLLAAFLAAPNARVSPLDERSALKRAEELEQQFASENCLSGLTKSCLAMLSDMRAIESAVPETYRGPITAILTACRDAETNDKYNDLDSVPRHKFKCD